MPTCAPPPPRHRTPPPSPRSAHLGQLPVPLPQSCQHLLHKHVYGVLLRGRGEVQAAALVSGCITPLLAEGEEGDWQQVTLAQQLDKVSQLRSFTAAPTTATTTCKSAWQRAP